MVSEQFSNWNNVARENGRKFVIDIICEAPWEQNVHIGWCFFFLFVFRRKQNSNTKAWAMISARQGTSASPVANNNNKSN